MFVIPFHELKIKLNKSSEKNEKFDKESCYLAEVHYTERIQHCECINFRKSDGSTRFIVKKNCTNIGDGLTWSCDTCKCSWKERKFSTYTLFTRLKVIKASEWFDWISHVRLCLVSIFSITFVRFFSFNFHWYLIQKILHSSIMKALKRSTKHPLFLLDKGAYWVRSFEIV